eukprot:scaffold36026_cov57-Phaeocystis_antarctica.AAC.2
MVRVSGISVCSMTCDQPPIRPRSSPRLTPHRCNCCYNYRLGYPLTTWGEQLSIMLQLEVLGIATPTATPNTLALTH